MGDVAAIQEVVTALRNIRAELKLDPKKRVAAEFLYSDVGAGALIQENRGAMRGSAVLSELRIVPRQTVRCEKRGGALDGYL